MGLRTKRGGTTGCNSKPRNAEVCTSSSDKLTKCRVVSSANFERRAYQEAAAPEVHIWRIHVQYAFAETLAVLSERPTLYLMLTVLTAENLVSKRTGNTSCRRSSYATRQPQA